MQLRVDFVCFGLLDAQINVFFCQFLFVFFCAALSTPPHVQADHCRNEDEDDHGRSDSQTQEKSQLRRGVVIDALLVVQVAPIKYVRVVGAARVVAIVSYSLLMNWFGL